MESNSLTMEAFLAMMEYPFVRPDMTMEEFHKEKEYFIQHYEEYKAGTYEPLWKQK